MAPVVRAAAGFLMVLLFFGGAMNLHWIGGLALFVLFEKAVPTGHWLTRAAGAVRAAGAWLLAGAPWLAHPHRLRGQKHRQRRPH